MAREVTFTCIRCGETDQQTKRGVPRTRCAKCVRIHNVERSAAAHVRRRQQSQPAQTTPAPLE